MKLLAFLLAAQSCFALGQFRQSLTIDHTKCGSSDSSNFPVLVKLSGAQYKTAANGGHVRNASGFDVLFWSNATFTSALTWEIDFYDGTNGVGWFWVKLPTVSASADTVFYVTYGDPAITTFQSTASSVWSNSYNYVWHGGDGSTLALTDSTTNANTATNSATPVTATSGQIAGAGAFAAASSETLTVDTDPAAAQPTTLTMSMWVNFTSTTGTRAVLRKNGGGYRIFGTAAGTALTYNVFDSGVNSVSAATPNSINDGTWRYLVATFNATSSTSQALKTYTGGTAGNTANAVATGNINYSAGSFRIGSDNATNFWQGSIDEVHIAAGARSADWITTEFNNQNAPSTFITAGAEVRSSSLAALGVN